MPAPNSTANAITLEDALDIVRRHFRVALIIFFAVLILAVVAIEFLPPRYRSTAIVSVESQQIPEGLVQSTVSGYADERIGFVNQRIMTTARLLDVIDRFDLYAEKRGSTPASVLVEELQENIFLETIRDHAITRRGTTSTVAFSLSFEHRDPETAAAVANDLVTMFLEENVKTRTARATETTEFLTRQAERLNEQVRAMDAKVANYKQEHSDGLPEHLELRIGMLENAETDLRTLERDTRALEEERRFLETQQASLGAMLGTSPGQTTLSPAQQLAALRVEFAEKSSVYASAHPDLRSLKLRIASLKREINASEGAQDETSSDAASNPASLQIEAQIASADAKIGTMLTQREKLQAKIDALRSQIVEAPQVEKELKDLTREYESAMEEFEDIKSKQRDAELAENLEVQEKAERLTLLEAPRVPSVPVWPVKRIAYGLGFALAIASGVGTVLIPEVLDKSIRGTAALTSLIKNAPVVVIPYVENSSDKRRKRRRQWLILLFVCFALFAGLTAVHFFLNPLDLLVVSLLEQILGR